MAPTHTHPFVRWFLLDLDPKNLGVALRPSYYTLRNGGGKGRRAPGAATSLIARVRASALTNADVGWRMCDGVLAWGGSLVGILQGGQVLGVLAPETRPKKVRSRVRLRGVRVRCSLAHMCARV